MTTATRNEAADRLRAHLTEDHGGCAWAEEGRDGDWIELALAAERRATVERIRVMFGEYLAGFPTANRTVLYQRALAFAERLAQMAEQDVSPDEEGAR